MKKSQRNSIVACVLGTFAALSGIAQQAQAQVDLGTAGDFSVLAGSMVPNTGSSVIDGGHVGVSPGSAITGFPPGIVVPPYTIHAMDAVAAQAQSDLTIAYNVAAGLAPDESFLPVADIGGLTRGPGVYFFPTSAAITGTLTLDAENDPDALFVFQIGSTLITASNAEVVIINGFPTSGCNVFWQVGSSATLGTDTAFQGHILALASITLNTGATIVNGSALARTAAVTLDSNDITNGCITGACCTVGACEILTPTECTALLGDYRGDDTLCVDEDCTPPTCDAGGPYSVPCNSATTLIQLDGSGSSDPEVSLLTYLWATTCPGILGFNDNTIVNPILTIDASFLSFCPLSCEVSLTVGDGTFTTTCTAPVSVVDITGPTISCVAVDVALDLGCLGLIPFTVTVADACCVNPASIVVTADAGALGDVVVGAVVITNSVQLPGGVGYTLTGTVAVSDVTDCPATVVITVDAEDCCGTAGTTSTCSAVVSDITAPTLGLCTAVGGAVNAACEISVPFSAVFVDQCCMDDSALTATVVVDVDGGSAATIDAAIVSRVLSLGGTTLTVSGTVLVSDLVGCSSSIHILVNALDCCGNAAPSCEQSVLVSDGTGPAITCPANITRECGESTDPTATGTASATDNCDTTIAPTFTDVNNLLGCAGTGTILRTWTVADSCGAMATCVQTITVADVTPSVITCPVDLSVQCGQSTAPAVTGLAIATDVCDTAVTVTFADVNSLGGCDGTGTIARTWTALDDCGVVSTCVQIITVIDDVDPVITCPAAITIECAASTDPSVTLSATATDNCDIAIAITFTDVESLLGCSGTGTIVRTWLALDACGNSSTCIQTINVQDTVGLSITCPADLSVECGQSTAPAITGSAVVTATDVCDISVVATFADVDSLGGCGGTGTIARTWTAIDACGNVSSCLQVITVGDDGDPVITCPANIAIGCGQSTDPSVTLSATATDNCGIAMAVTFTDANNLLGCNGTGAISRTWLATDDCGNSSTCVQLITIQDIVGPTITCPANLSVPCGQSTAPAVTGSATATDLCDISVTVTFADVNGLSGCDGIGPIARTWTAMDDCGNVSTCLQTITLFDSGVPLIMCPPSITRECGQSTAPSATGIPIASDTCDTAITPTFTDVNNLSGCDGTGTIVRTWRAQDDCGNFNTCSQTITVQDTVGPTITCPANLSVQCGQPTGPAVTGSATATDLCDTSVTPTFSDVSSLGGCDGTGTITRTWISTDDCGNATSCVQTITVVDNVNPVITCPANITRECGQSTIPSVTGLASATDNCDTAITPSFTDQSNLLGCDGTGTIARLWRAQDDCGNFSTCTQTITVRDIVGPTITCPANLAVQCGQPTGPAVTGLATATDSCDIAVVPTFVDVNSLGSCGGTGTIARTWTAIDDCGNVSTCVQTITLFDDVVPVINCAVNITIECGQSTAPSATGTPGVTDNCDTTITPTFIDQNNLLGCNGTGTITRTWRAQDDCGNFSTCLQTITIQDSVGPTITCPANHSVQCGQSIVPLDTGLATATDACDTSMMVTFADVNSLGGCNGTGIITRTWSVLDDCGNASSCVQTINVIDTTIPLMTCPPDIALTCETLDGMPVNAVLITNGLAVDNCDTVVPVTDDRPISGFYPVSCDALGTAITYTATDECGNVASCVMYVRVGGGLCCPGGTDTDLKLMVGNLDLRQDTDGPVTTKARFDVWNSNEVRFSGTERCITCWDETLISNYGPLANHLVLENLQTDKGKARIQNEGSTVCPNSSESPLLGVAIREYQFLGDPSVSMRSAVTLVGMGEQPARIQYDIIEEPEEAADGGLIMGPTVVPRGLSVSPLAPLINHGGNSSAGGVADNRASTTFKGSLIFWPVIEVKWDANGTLIQDTFIQLLNDNPGEVKVQLYQVNGDSPLDPVIDQNTMELIERGHPGWNWSDFQITLTGDESAYWSVASGLPKGVSPIAVLDPGNPNGRPDLDPSNPGGRVIRGFLVGWAVNDDGHEIRWNHLKGHVLGIRYDQGTAYDYNPWSFRVVSGVPEGSESDGDPGNLSLDGIEYDLAPSALLFDFFATGSQAFSHPSQRE